MRNVKTYTALVTLNLFCIIGILLDTRVLVNNNVPNDIVLYIIISLIIFVVSMDIIFILLYKRYVNADQEQKRFITNSIHSLRTPLTIISANADLLELENDIQYINNIRNEVDKVEKLSSNLINYSMLKENVFYKACDFNISEIILDECNKVKVLYEKLNIKFSYDLENNVIWHANSGRVMILFTTLLDNAAKYCTSEVSCKLTSKYLEVSNDTNLKDGNYIYLFERFKRNNSNTKGFGVGLSVVKMISEIYNMKLEANVVKGKMIIRINKKG